MDLRSVSGGAALGTERRQAHSDLLPTPQGMRSTVQEVWQWTQSGVFQLTDGPNGGVAVSFDEAKAAFRAAWEAGRVVRFFRKLRTKNAQPEPVC